MYPYTRPSGFDVIVSTMSQYAYHFERAVDEFEFMKKCNTLVLHAADAERFKELVPFRYPSKPMSEWERPARSRTRLTTTNATYRSVMFDLVIVEPFTEHAPHYRAEYIAERHAKMVQDYGSQHEDTALLWFIDEAGTLIGAGYAEVAQTRYNKRTRTLTIGLATFSAA